MTWTVRLRDHESGRILESSDHRSPDGAMAAYRILLGRADLDGRPLAAVFKPPVGAVGRGNNSTFFSRFDTQIGRGRIAPDDPRLDPFATRQEADGIALSMPPPSPVRAPHDWEADPRDMKDCLREWQRSRGGREGAASELRVSFSTYEGWVAGRPAAQEKMIRRLMVLLDRSDP